MKTTTLKIPGVLLVEPRRFGDARGWFMETWQAQRYQELGVPARFVQDNQSYSQRGVLRGLHIQHPHGQGKLVQVLQGEVYDVAVDIRRGSPWFGQWAGARLSAENGHQLYIPEGFAHGFKVLSDEVLFCYKCTDYYHPETQFSVRWDDPQLAIDWPDEQIAPLVSDKDRDAPLLSGIPETQLPRYVADRAR